MGPAEPDTGTEVVVGRVGRPHGVRGQVAVEVRTDQPERRFAAGQRLRLSRPHGGRTELEVLAARPHAGRLLVTFAEVGDRTVAEALRGTLLSVVVDPGEVPDDPEEFYDHQLVGLQVEDGSGAPLGTVSAVTHLPGQDLIAVSWPGPAGPREVLVPFVRAIVTQVSVATGRVVVDPPPGLFVTEDAVDAGGPSASSADGTVQPGR
jgi:16S rRNA processing protein RimM